MMRNNGSTPEILAEARTLICRQPPFSSEDFRLFIDAAELIPRDEPIAYTDTRILRAADQLAPFYAERPPKPETPFDSRIEAALAEEVEMQTALEAATEVRNERVLDFASLTGSTSVMLKGRDGRNVTIWCTALEGKLQGSESANRRDVDRALVAAQASQEAVGLALEAFKRARVAKNELEQARSRWRATASVVD